MKKFYFISFIFTTFFTYGQLSENFDAAATLPVGWTTFIGTNGLGTAQNWATSTTRYYSGTRSAFVRYEDVSGGEAEDWLITPLINLTNYTGASLTFYGGEQYSAVYVTDYSIRVSTTLPTGPSNFTTVVSYTEGDFSDVTTPMLQAGDLKTVDLTAFDGQQIYIAFVMTQDDGDNWFIDNVNVTGTLGNVTFDGEIKTSVFPNPTNGTLNISSNATFEKSVLYDILGKEVKSFGNDTSLDISSVTPGVYILRIFTTEETVLSHRIVKN